MSRFLRAGTDADGSLCQSKFSTEPVGDHVLLWKFDTKVIKVAGGLSTLQVHWTRSRAGSTVAERDETRTITLGSGDTHVVDFVENQSDSSAACASLMVRLSADPILPEASQPVTIDLWTVDENGPEGARSVHQRVQGLGGDSLGYRLPPLDVAGVGAPAWRAVKLEVSGTVQAALAADGQVDVTLTAVRRTVSGKATIQGEGRLQFRTKVGETAAVLLPEPAGRLPLSEGDGFIDVGRLFAGRRVSLYVKVDAAR